MHISIEFCTNVAITKNTAMFGRKMCTFCQCVHLCSMKLDTHSGWQYFSLHVVQYVGSIDPFKNQPQFGKRAAQTGAGIVIEVRNLVSKK